MIQHDTCWLSRQTSNSEMTKNVFLKTDEIQKKHEYGT